MSLISRILGRLGLGDPVSFDDLVVRSKPVSVPRELIARFDAGWYSRRYQVESGLGPDAREVVAEYLSCVGPDLHDPNPYFREDWYRSHYPDVATAIAQGHVRCGFEHYLRAGFAEGRAPGPVRVWEPWYLETHPEAKARIANGEVASALEHYLLFGALAQLDPHPAFSELWYLEQNRDVPQLVQSGRFLSGYEHFLVLGLREGRRPSPDVDELSYRAANPDVDMNLRLGAIERAYLHLVDVGLAEGRPWTRGTHTNDGALTPDLPSTHFDPAWYLLAYPEVGEEIRGGVVASARDHYLQRGIAAGWDPNPRFSESWYRRANPEVARAIELGEFSSGFEHYVRCGFAEGKVPSPIVVDSEWYQNRYPDVARALGAGEFRSALEHYLLRGAAEGRDPNPAFDERWYLDVYPEVAVAVRSGRWISGFHHLIEVGLELGSSPCRAYQEDYYLAHNRDVGELVRRGVFRCGYEHLLRCGLQQGRQWHPDERRNAVRQAAFALARLRLDTFLSSDRVLDFATSQTPRVSLVVVVHNAAALTFQCLESLRCLEGGPFEIVIVDNNSSDQTRQLLQRTSGLTIQRNEENLGFVRAANSAALELARGTHLLFLNNDTVVFPGTVEAAVRRLQSAADVGAVGGRVVGCDGALQEAGCIVQSDGVTAGYGAGADPTSSAFLSPREVDYCSGVFLLTSRALFQELGGFDETFAPAYYEEVDYCYRLRQRGYRVVYEPSSVLLHLGQGSLSKPWQVNDFLRQNRPRFVARHKAALESAPTLKAPVVAPPVGSGGGRVPFAEDQEPRGQLSSGRARPQPVRILVLGMHRSGTSAVAGLLEQLGCFVGDEPDLMPAKPDNPLGFWEREDMRALNDAVLAAAGLQWDTVCEVPLPSIASEVLEPIKVRVAELVARMDRRSPWAIKDPRLALTLPLLRGVLQPTVVVLVQRPPLEVALSLSRREGFPLLLGLALWEVYTRALLTAAVPLNPVRVDYPTLLRDPMAGATRLLREVSSRAPGAALRLPSASAVAAAVRPGLRHERAEDVSSITLSDEQAELLRVVDAGRAPAPGDRQVSRHSRELIAVYRHCRRAQVELEDRVHQMWLEKHQLHERYTNAWAETQRLARVPAQGRSELEGPGQ